MIICSVCGTELVDGAKFCNNCGSPVAEKVNEKEPVVETVAEPVVETVAEPVVETVAEPVVETVAEPVAETVAEPVVETVAEPVAETVAEPVVETPVAQAVAEPIAQPVAEPVHQAEAPKQKKEKKPKAEKGKNNTGLLIGIFAGALVLIFIVVTVLLSVVGGVSIFSFSNKKSSINDIFYIKDDEVMYASLNKKKPVQLTEDINETRFTYDIILSEDGKTIFYPDNVDTYSYSMNLYYKQMNSDKQPEKIDSDIFTYCINQKADKVFYIKGTESKLYVNNLKDKEKIDGDVSRFYINPQGTKILYQTYEGNLYIKDIKKLNDDGSQKEKIDSEAELVDVSENLDTIYYIKGEALYVKREGKDKEKIIGDVSYIAQMYDSGEFYYVHSEDIEKTLLDYVDDDMKDADEKVKEPVRPDYPSIWDYDETDDYYAAKDVYNAALDEYNKQYDEYKAKQKRDNIRKRLAEETMTTTVSTLYFFDGKETKEIVSGENWWISGSSSAKAIMTYATTPESEKKTIKMSEVKSTSDVYDIMYDYSDEVQKTDMFVVTGSEISEIDQENADNIWFNNDSSSFYFIDGVNYNENDFSGDLYRIDIKGTSIGEPELYQEDVNSYYLVLADDSIVTFEDVSDSSEGDMYINKKSVDSDVDIYSVAEYDGMLTYKTDTDDNYIGTVKIYNGKDTKKVSDDVYSYFVIGGKKIALIVDYSTKRDEGDLYLYDGSKENKYIDDGVSEFAYIYYGSPYCGGNY